MPQVVKSDNGPPFNGHEFAQFADYLGFKHRRVTPLWPEANGEVERFMTGSKRCTSSCETIEQLLIVLLVSLPPLPSLEDQSGSS